MGTTGIGVLHTTEGLNVDGAWSTLNKGHSAPHFIVGGDRIIQCRPLGVQAAASRTPSRLPHGCHALLLA